MPARKSALFVLPAVAAAVIGLTGCDSKTGTAAVVNGSKISESSLTDYLGPNVKPIPDSQGGSTPARLFVLQVLVRNAVLPRVLDATGGPATPAQLSTARDQLLEGGSLGQLQSQLTGLGLQAKFAEQYLDQQEMIGIVQTRVASQEQLDAALKKAALSVSISPRYGSWDGAALTVKDLGKQDLPDAVSLSTTLPGDATPAPTQ
ncbi:MAG: hypothetical protein JWN95_2572 [Frankiales bacterium]|nr:hypothetical protein [Frankiales bacterium]